DGGDDSRARADFADAVVSAVRDVDVARCIGDDARRPIESGDRRGAAVIGSAAGECKNRLSEILLRQSNADDTCRNDAECSSVAETHWTTPLARRSENWCNGSLERLGPVALPQCRLATAGCQF